MTVPLIGMCCQPASALLLLSVGSSLPHEGALIHLIQFGAINQVFMEHPWSWARLHGQVLNLVSVLWDSIFRRQCPSTRKGVVISAGGWWRVGRGLEDAISKRRRIKRGQATWCGGASIGWDLGDWIGVLALPLMMGYVLAWILFPPKLMSTQSLWMWPYWK